MAGSQRQVSKHPVATQHQGQWPSAQAQTQILDSAAAQWEDTSTHLTQWFGEPKEALHIKDLVWYLTYHKHEK